MRKGFTLVELLVVVSIIALLSTVTISSLNSARARARDAQRELDIKTIQTALESYYISNGVYPQTSNVYSYEAGWQNTFGAALGINIPVDPINESSLPAHSGGYNYRYFAHSNPVYCSGQSYFLNFNKETSSGDGPNDGVVMCNGATPETSTRYTYDSSFVVGVGSDGKIN